MPQTNVMTQSELESATSTFTTAVRAPGADKASLISAFKAQIATAQAANLNVSAANSAVAANPA